MFDRIKEAYRKRKMAKLAEKDLFHSKLDIVEVKIGKFNYKASFERLDINDFLPTKESYSITHPSVEISKNEIRIKGMDKKNKNFFIRTIEKNQVKWHKVKYYDMKNYWIFPLFEENSGYLSMELKNGDCMVLFFEETGAFNARKKRKRKAK